MKRKIVLALVLMAGLAGLMLYTRSDRSSGREPDPIAGLDALKERPATSQRLSIVEKLASQATTITSVPETAATNWISGWILGEPPPHLTLQQAEAYLAQYQRGAENLVAASDATGDRKFLHEAMEKFPNDPRVALRAAYLSGASETEEDSNRVRRKWLDVLQQSAPDNAVADYLSAADHFRTGDKSKAIDELVAAAQKPMQDYSLDFIQNIEEAYRNAGYSEAQAKAIAADSLLLPQLAQYKSAGVSLVEMAKAYQQSGDNALAQGALQMAIDLGQRLNTPDSLTLIGPLVGLAIERMAFNTMGPGNSYDDTGQTAQNQIDAIVQQRAAFRQLSQQQASFLPKMSEPEIIGFLDRQKISGSAAAIRWAAAKYGP